jgi:aminoglycoside phosphotransferase (APT) family kinase protein
MQSLDKGQTNLCHGDIHPYNIMYSGDKHWIIDWEDASKGAPAADACMSYFYSLRWSAKDKKDSAEEYLQLFCKASGIPREDVLAWLPVIAGVQVNIEDDEDRAFISNFIDERKNQKEALQ